MTFFRWSFLLHKVWQCRFDAAVVPWFKWPDRDKTLRHRRRRWRGRWRQHNIRATNYRKKTNSRTLRQQTVYFAMILFSARSLSLSWWTPMSCLMCANDTHTNRLPRSTKGIRVFHCLMGRSIQKPQANAVHFKANHRGSEAMAARRKRPSGPGITYIERLEPTSLAWNFAPKAVGRCRINVACTYTPTFTWTVLYIHYACTYFDIYIYFDIYTCTSISCTCISMHLICR
jgi:hypothetical protein